MYAMAEWQFRAVAEGGEFRREIVKTNIGDAYRRLGATYLGRCNGSHLKIREHMKALARRLGLSVRALDEAALAWQDRGGPADDFQAALEAWEAAWMEAAEALRKHDAAPVKRQMALDPAKEQLPA